MLSRLYIFIFRFQTLIKEMEGNLSFLEKLKDFDKRKGKEIAARAYQDLEIMELKVIIKKITMYLDG